MAATDFQLEARMRVLNFFNDFRLEGVPELNLDMVYVVWFCKTLQNWKALVSTQLPDGIYYEVTYDGDAKETHLDVYTKAYNFVISQAEEENPDQLTISDIQEETDNDTESADEAGPNTGTPDADPEGQEV
jgi:hypothetical protein